MMAQEMLLGVQGQDRHWEQPAMYDPRSVRRGPQIRDAMPPLQPQRRAGFQPPPPPPQPPQARHNFRCEACNFMLKHALLSAVGLVH